MAPVDTDNDDRIRAKKNLRIVFLHFDGMESNPNSTWHDRDRLFRLRTPQTAAANRSQVLANAAKFAAPQNAEDQVVTKSVWEHKITI
jgi:hypothetical protein